MSRCDLLVHGGTVIDPATRLHATRDVAITNGRIAALEPAIPADQAIESIDARGKLVVPGLIDLHTHIFNGVGDGANLERDCLARGTTTALDAGSIGSRAFAGLKEHIIEKSRVRLKVWLNISSIGLIDTRVGELMNLNYVDIDSAVQTADANRDLIIGFKIRVSGYVAGGTCKPALKLAREAADATKLPLMVHIGESFEPLTEVLEFLRPRDVVTHTLTGRRHGILDYSGTVLPAVRDARQSGIHFDAAHGRMHWGFAMIRRALEQDFLPDTISTDITRPSATDPGFHLPQIMSKLMALGLGLDEAVALATANSAGYIGLQDEVGTLRPGASADVAILELLEGEFSLRDNEGQTLTARQRLRPWKTIRAGQVADASPDA